MAMKYAEIAVDSPVRQAMTFSYSIPAGMDVAVGQAVRVPFGHRTLLGVVMELTDLPAFEQTKDIIAVVGDGPVLFLHQVRLALWMGRNYLASPFDCASLMLPPGFETKPAGVKPKVIRYVELAVDFDAATAAVKGTAWRSQKQLRAFTLLVERRGTMPARDLIEGAECDVPSIQALEKKGLVRSCWVEVTRDPLSDSTFLSVPLPEPTAGQRAAIAAIREAQTAGSAPCRFLLHGVTGSGKTEVYLRALADAVTRGKRGIVLVPEIALTPQTISRFASRFPGKVAVLHSRLSPGEQFDEWQRIRRGEFSVVVGSRGALFAPQPDLGLIVIDEEHEWSYKQHEQSPRYHCRPVAEKLAELTGATLVLGSATPDIETYHRAIQGHYRLVELPERITARGDTSMTAIEVVDVREEYKAGNRGIFSRKLFEAMKEALDRREQIILFLNRRGSSTVVQCRNCGFVLKCRRCDVSLTYHAESQLLVCHQCNRKLRPPLECPRCRSHGLKYLGVGTQKVEEAALAAFPAARVLRWDRDTSAEKHAHERIMEEFLSHKADVLIGTQMIAKGLDLPMVTLVGVVSADISLYLPDFRSAERTFQLLSQVAGRAGRGMYGGRVIIQTFNPYHYAIVAASGNDYRRFYEKEIEYRRQQGNPPFSRMTRLAYSHTNYQACQREAERVSRLLAEALESSRMSPDALVGPAPCFVQRVRGRFRWQIILRHDNPASLLSGIRLPAGWVVDIDPVSVL